MIPQTVFSELSALVGNRIWPNRFAQPDGAPPTWPAIRYSLVSNDPASSICGTDPEDTDDVRVQIDVVAATYAAMRTLKAQVISALDVSDPPAIRLSGFETYDVETKTHRASIDFLFQQSSATP